MNEIVLAGRLTVPLGSAALLFDMDGVLLDTLRLDYEIVERLQGELGDGRPVSNSFIRANFAYDPEEFLRRILAEAGIAIDAARFARLLEDYERARRLGPHPVHPGISEILTAARSEGLRIAVVSNNPELQVDAMLSGAGLRRAVDEVVGNDRPGLRKKPAPDTYLEAARRLGLAPAQCVAIEDSLVGVESAGRAGCHTVAVATGANDLDDLCRSPHVSRCYMNFE